MKIVKASTVYKKAKSVDKAVLLENYVAERIDEAMRRGEFEETIYIGGEAAAVVLEKLNLSGYNVSPVVYECALCDVGNSGGFWRKLLDTICGKKEVPHELMSHYVPDMYLVGWEYADDLIKL